MFSAKRPDDQAFQAALIETVTARLEQVLAEAEALIHRRNVKLVDLALMRSARAGEAERWRSR